MNSTFRTFLMAHRSIRTYQDRPVDSELIDRVLEESFQGSSSSGNLNMVSVIKTFDTERKAHLCKLHFNQPMVLQAPLVLTFCADSFRTRQWLAQRGARLNFGNFISWHVAAFDAIILAQTTALAQYYTSDMKYPPQEFANDSAKLHALLEAKGFLP